MPFLLLSPVGFQEVPHSVISEGFFRVRMISLCSFSLICAILVMEKGSLGIIVSSCLHYPVPILEGGGRVFFGKRGFADEMKGSSGGFL